MHNLDCVALPHDETLAWKDDKIKELEKEVKDIEKKTTEKGLQFFWCLADGSNGFWEIWWRPRREQRYFNMQFNKDVDCLQIKEIKGSSTWTWGWNRRYHTNEMSMEFHKNKNLKNPYLNDLKTCETRWGNAWVCLFWWNNPTKLTELYLTEWDIYPTASCQYRERWWELRCMWAWGWRGSWHNYDWDALVPENRWFITLWNLFPHGQNPVKLSYYPSFFREFKIFTSDIENYTATLNENILWDRSVIKKYKIVGVRYGETKTYKKYQTDICITSVGCFWVWPNANTVLTEKDWIKTFDNAKKYRPGKHTSGYSKADDGAMRWWVLYQTSQDRRYEKETFNAYEFKDMLLFK